MKIDTPTIADLTNMQHTHTNVVNGGLLGSVPFQIGEADVSGNYELDATLYKDWIIGEVTDATIINLNNTVNGDAGMIEVIMDGTGGYAVEFGIMFTKQMGEKVLDTAAGKDNIISWRKVGESNIIYTIAQIEA